MRTKGDPMIRTTTRNRGPQRLATGGVAAALMLAMAAPAFAVDLKASSLSSTDPAVQSQLRVYVSGVWSGMVVSDIALQEDHQKRVICPAGDYGPTDDELLGIVKSFADDNKAVLKDQDYEVSIIAFFAFRKKFPCPS